MIAPVCVGGFAVVLAAAITLARTPESLATWIGIVAFLVASTLAERFPVPLDGVEANGVSLTFVFGVAAIDLFGWAPGVLIAFTAPLVMQIIEHRPPIRICSNAAAFALSALPRAPRSSRSAAAAAGRSCCGSRCARSSSTR